MNFPLRALQGLNFYSYTWNIHISHRQFQFGDECTCMSTLGKYGGESSIIDISPQIFSECFKPDNTYFYFILLHSLFGKDLPAQKGRTDIITLIIIHS